MACMSSIHSKQESCLMKQLVLVRLSSMMAETVVCTLYFVYFGFFFNQSAHTQDPLRSLDMQLVSQVVLRDACIWSYLIWGEKHLLWFNSIQSSKKLSLQMRFTVSSMLTYNAAGSQFSVKLFPIGTGLTWRDQLQSNSYYFKKTNAFVFFQREKSKKGFIIEECRHNFKTSPYKKIMHLIWADTFIQVFA